MTRVLIVEDEVDLAELLLQLLHAEGMAVHVLNEGSEAVDWVRNHSPDVVLLDIMLPGKDGIAICREIREFSEIPIIMTTAKIEEVDRLVGFETGATDYICKPYSSREVIARIKSLVRLYKCGYGRDGNDSLVLDGDNLRASYKEKTIELSRTEYNLLSLLMNHSDRIYTRARIIEEVYADHRIVTERNVDSHIKNLRKKLAELGSGRDFIRSVYGAGYRFEC